MPSHGAIPASAEVRGYSKVDASESVTTSTYSYLATADRVQNVVMPTMGLLGIGFFGYWKAADAGDVGGRAALFVGSNQLKMWVGTANQAMAQSAAIDAFAGSNNWSALVSYLGGLMGVYGDDPSLANPAPGTGVPIAAYTNRGGRFAENDGSTLTPSEHTYGGLCWVLVDAGTYDVGVKFRDVDGSGSVSAQRRKLWVLSFNFG